MIYRAWQACRPRPLPEAAAGETRMAVLMVTVSLSASDRPIKCAMRGYEGQGDAVEAIIDLMRQ